MNLSAKQFQHQNVCAVVERALKDFAVDPALLEFAITESTAMHSAEEAIVIRAQFAFLADNAGDVARGF